MNRDKKSKRKKGGAQKSPRNVSEGVVTVHHHRRTKSDGKNEAPLRKISFDQPEETAKEEEAHEVHNPLGLISSNNVKVDLTKYMKPVRHGDPIKSSPMLGRKSVFVSVVPLTSSKLKPKQSGRELSDRRSALRLTKLDKPQKMVSSREEAKRPVGRVGAEWKLRVMDRGLLIQQDCFVGRVNDDKHKNAFRVRCDDGELYCSFGEAHVQKFVSEFLKHGGRCEGADIELIEGSVRKLMQQKSFGESVSLNRNGMMSFPYDSRVGKLMRMFYLLCLSHLKKKLEERVDDRWPIGTISDTFCPCVYEVREGASADGHVIHANHIFVQLFLQCHLPITTPGRVCEAKMMTV